MCKEDLWIANGERLNITDVLRCAGYLNAIEIGRLTRKKGKTEISIVPCLKLREEAGEDERREAAIVTGVVMELLKFFGE